MASMSEKALSISRFKKERFLGSLSEDDFRDRVVRPLYYRLGYDDGRDLCGPIEKGKDAVFCERNKLGQIDFVAVQTKKGNLNMSAKVTRNIESAIVQLRTAIATSIPRIGDNRKVYPAKVHLCASGKINEHARHHIVETVDDPRIGFLDSDELIPLIDENYPEVWLDIDCEILPYYRAIVSRVEKGPVVPVEGLDLSSDVLTGAATDNSFVSLNLYRTTVEKKKVRGQIKEFPKFEEIGVSKVVEHKKQRVLILGEAGSGKSTALLRIAYDLARSGAELKSGYKIPILLKAIDLARERPESIADFCDTKSMEFGRLKKSCFTLKNLEDGDVVLLVDALDEIADRVRQEYVARKLSEFSEQYPKVKVILSARPYAFIRDLDALSSFTIFTVSPISWKQATKIVVNLQRRKAADPSESKELIRRIEQVHGIELSPLLVTVFAATAELSRQDIPANITELFKKFTELMLGRWDENKGLNQQYQAPLKDFLLQRIAFSMHRARRTTIPIDEFKYQIENELERRGHEAQVDTIIDELLNRSGLLGLVGSDVEFRHLLLQEFFAGRGIASEQFVKSNIQDDWWKRAIVFYFGERPDNVESLKGALESIDGLSSDHYFEAATTVGLALQACYLSEVAEKLEIWKSVATALSVGSDALSEVTEKDSKYPMTEFVGYYLYGRDSVALSNIVNYSDEIRSWANEVTTGRKSLSEARLFWLVVGLIECGEVRMAEDVLAKTKIKTGIYLLAIHIGCFMAHKVRQLQKDEKKSARRICESLEKQIQPMRVQLNKEFGSQLLEVRKGRVEVVDEEDQE